MKEDKPTIRGKVKKYCSKHELSLIIYSTAIILAILVGVMLEYFKNADYVKMRNQVPSNIAKQMPRKENDTKYRANYSLVLIALNQNYQSGQIIIKTMHSTWQLNYDESLNEGRIKNTTAKPVLQKIKLSDLKLRQNPLKIINDNLKIFATSNETQVQIQHKIKLHLEQILAHDRYLKADAILDKHKQKCEYLRVRIYRAQANGVPKLKQKLKEVKITQLNQKQRL